MTPNTILHLAENQLAIDRLANPDNGIAGWVRVAKIPVENDDYPKALAAAKAEIGERAIVLATLPLDQVKLLDLEGEGLSRQKVVNAVSAETPIDPSNLCIDWFSHNGRTLVAAVASTTVTEAASFLDSCGITVHSFAALPAGTWGDRFAFFGNGGPTETDTSAPPAVPYVLIPQETPHQSKIIPDSPAKEAPPVHLITPEESETAPQVALVGDAISSTGRSLAANKGVVEAPKKVPSQPQERVSKVPPPVKKTAVPPGSVRGKPKHLGLILTAILLVFLLAVGAWASTAGRPIIAAWFGVSPPVLTADEIDFDPDQPLVQLETVDVSSAISSDDTSNPMIDQAPDLSGLRTDLAQLSQPRARPAVATPSGLGGVVLDNSDTLAGLQVETVSLAQPRPQLSAPSGLSQPGFDPPDIHTQHMAPSGETLFLNDPVAASPQTTPDLPNAPVRSTTLTIPTAPPPNDTIPLGISPQQDPNINVGLPLINLIAVLSPEQRYVVSGVWIFPPSRPGRTVLEGPVRSMVRGPFSTSPMQRDRPSIVPFSQPIDTLPRFGAPLVEDNQPRYQPGLAGETVEGDTPSIALDNNVQQPKRPRVRPQLRPTADLEAAERERLGGYTLVELASYRPSSRPEEILREARAAAKRAEDLANRPPNVLAVASSVRPTLRPSAIVTAARRDAQTPVTPTRRNEVARPTGQTRASVAKAATETRQIRMNRTALLGISGPTSNRRALVRLSNGKIIRVRVGDRLDGGRVAAISATQLRYVKSGRNVSLRLP